MYKLPTKESLALFIDYCTEYDLLNSSNTLSLSDYRKCIGYMPMFDSAYRIGQDDRHEKYLYFAKQIYGFTVEFYVYKWTTLKTDYRTYYKPINGKINICLTAKTKNELINDKKKSKRQLILVSSIFAFACLFLVIYLLLISRLPDFGKNPMWIILLALPLIMLIYLYYGIGIIKDLRSDIRLDRYWTKNLKIFTRKSIRRYE